MTSSSRRWRADIDCFSCFRWTTEPLGLIGRSAASFPAQCAPSSPVPRLLPLQIALCLASFTLTSSPRLTVLCIASPLAPGWQTRMIGPHELRMREPPDIDYSFGAAASGARSARATHATRLSEAGPRAAFSCPPPTLAGTSGQHQDRQAQRTARRRARGGRARRQRRRQQRPAAAAAAARAARGARRSARSARGSAPGRAGAARGLWEGENLRLSALCRMCMCVAVLCVR